MTIKHYVRKEPMRVETLICQRKTKIKEIAKMKQDIGGFFLNLQKFLQEMDSYPKQEVAKINDLLQAVGQGINTVDSELVRRRNNVR